MKTLTRSVGRPEIGGESLPSVFRTFENNQVSLRRSELSMIAGEPGAGKSTLALAMALRMQVPTLYLSADTNAHTMAERPEYARDKLALANHIYWSFDSAPNLGDLDDEVTAIEEMLGRSPELIVVDNLMDVSMDGGEEFGGMRSAMKELKFLARDTNAAVLVLHHTKESYNSDPCPPRSAVQGMVNQLPALILTVGQQSGLMAVASVKNRYGKATPSGNDPLWLQFNPEYMYLADLEEAR